MQPQSTPSPYIIDVDMSGFVSEVIEKSMEVPVIVDFWAPWWEPCKTLGPIIEKVVKQAKGAVILAKVNIDEAQEIAAQMQIRSVPTVVAFVGGRPVDAFAGVKSESELKAFIEKIAPDVGPSEIDQLLEFAKAQEAEGNLKEAGGAYSQIVQMDETNNEALAGLATVFIKLGDLENAKNVLAEAPDKNNPAIRAAQAALDTAEQVGGLDDIETLRATIEKDADNYQARFDLALQLWASGKRDEAADQLLYIFKADKEWQDDGARKQLLKFFEVAGPMDPFTITARRKLSSLLFS